MQSTEIGALPFLILLFSNSLILDKKDTAMKRYLIPTMQVEEAQAAQMLAESLAINSTVTVDGSNALTKEDAAWDIWGEE